MFADDEELVRSACARECRAQDIEIVGEASDGRSAWRSRARYTRRRPARHQDAGADDGIRR